MPKHNCFLDEVSLWSSTSCVHSVYICDYICSFIADPCEVVISSVVIFVVLQQIRVVISVVICVVLQQIHVKKVWSPRTPSQSEPVFENGETSSMPSTDPEVGQTSLYTYYVFTNTKYNLHVTCEYHWCPHAICVQGFSACYLCLQHVSTCQQLVTSSVVC